MAKIDFTTGPRDDLWQLLEAFGLRPSQSRARENTTVNVSWMVPPYLERNELPAYGLKFHLSGSVLNAVILMRTVVPRLLERQYHFKTASSLEFITMLNAGFLGITQVGKLVTVYPRNSDELRELADLLVDLTEGFDGPFVPSDYKLDARGSVYYRYGEIASEEGQRDSACPEELNFEDTRTPVAPVPDWVIDPLRHRRHENTRATLPENLVVLDPLRQRGKGGVFRALQIDTHRERPDVPRVRRVILKEARRLGEVNRQGVDARDRLRWQYRCLQALEACPQFAEAIELFSVGEDLFLVMEDVGGRNLNEYLLDEPYTLADAYHILREVHAAMRAAHSAGITLCDISPDNVLIGENNRISLSDLEDSAGVGAPLQGGLGTPGFHPKRVEGELETGIARDYYALGAVAYALSDPHWYRRCREAVGDMAIWWDRPALPSHADVHLRAVIEHCLVEPTDFHLEKAERALAALQAPLPSPAGWLVANA